MNHTVIRKADAGWDDAMALFDCETCGGEAALERSHTSRHTRPFPSHEECPDCVDGQTNRNCESCNEELHADDVAGFEWNGRYGWPLCEKCVDEWALLLKEGME